MSRDESRAPRVVIVDDTPDIRYLLRLALEGGGITVVAEAGDGLAGIEATLEHQPDLVLLDLAMPVMDGLEALPRIKAAAPRARVLVLSGFTADAMADRALDAGAHGFVQKGTATGEIVRRVHEALGRVPVPTDHPSTPVAVADSMPEPRSAAQPTAEGEAGHDDLWQAAFAESPAGMVVLEREARRGWVVRAANCAALTLLGITETPSAWGQRLADLSAPLARLVERRDDAETESTTHVIALAGRLEVRTRRRGAMLHMALSPSAGSAEGQLLRNAISTTAHEIRNPVTVLVGVADAFTTRAESLTEQQREMLLAAVGRQASVLERLTDDLLVSARTLRGNLSIDVQPVEVVEVVRAAIADQPAAQPLTLSVPGAVWAMSDPTRLTQMVSNLLSNAVKYGAAPYAVEVRTLEAPEDGDAEPMVEIRVTDSGEGVPEEFRPRLFEEFSRAANNTARGTGLGLFLVRSLAQVQGGWADYEPRPDGGSTFTVTLRCASELREAEPEQAAAPPRGQAGRPDSE